VSEKRPAIFAGPAYNILYPPEIPLSYVMELTTDVTFVGNNLQQQNLQLWNVVGNFN